MTLADYIEALGDKQAAKVLGITERAAKSYRLRARTPRPAVAAKMVKRSLGQLTLAAIYSS